ncbi:hypothetical protein [Paenibacillus sp. NPDC058177]|uniref:hypothetical protein n=1 Tax=Paenibacillus sp. NPDC058177 TaxID=3346369 RepID=UPI0036D94881
MTTTMELANNKELDTQFDVNTSKMSLNDMKTEFLLKFHPTMMWLVRDYENVQRMKTSTLSSDDISNAYGGALSGEHGRELHRDVTANTTVLKHKREAIYSLYKEMSNIITIVLDSINDPYAHKIAQLLFIKGTRHKEVMAYMQRGYTKTLRPISQTQFAEKRLKAIQEASRSLEMLGILDLLVENKGVGRSKKMQFRIELEGWSSFEA